MRLSSFDIQKVIREICDQYAHIPGREGAIDAAGEPVVGHWDEGAMRRAVENLVNNAIKYGDGGAIKISSQQTRGRLMLTVHNDGAPIPEDRHNGIFEYLRREDNASTVEGWGVGLPFVQAMAQAHGGSVSVDSSAGTGTTFLIDVPVDCRPFVDGEAMAG